MRSSSCAGPSVHCPVAASYSSMFRCIGGVAGAPVAVQDPVAAADRDHRAVRQLHRVVVRAAVVQRRGGRPAGARVGLVERLRRRAAGSSCPVSGSEARSTPPISATRVEPLVLPGSSAPVPHVWRVGFGASSHESAPIRLSEKNQLSLGSGPATSTRPLGIWKVCG